MNGQNTLNGAEKEKANADAWTLVLGQKNRLPQEGNTTMPHVKLRNSFEALLEEEDLLQNQRANNVEEVVVCTPDALLGKSGSIGLRAVKEWLRTGRCQESSPSSSETQKLYETRQVSIGVDVRVPVQFVQSKRSVRDRFDKGCRFSQQALKQLTDLCHEEGPGLRVYVVVNECNKLPNACLSFDMLDLEVSANNMEWISSSIISRAHKYFNNLPIIWNGDKWTTMWMNAKMSCGRVNDSCIKKQLLICIEERVDSLDEVLHFHEEEMEDAMRQDVVLGWERLSKGGWAWTRGEGLCPSWETSLMFS